MSTTYTAYKTSNLNFNKNAFIKLLNKYGANESWTNIPNPTNNSTTSIVPSNTYEALGHYNTVYSKPIKEVDVPLTHNNMVPFFGGNSKQNIDIDNRRTAQRLDTFTGQFRLDQEHKVETNHLFAPTQQNLTGVEVNRSSDAMETYNSSCTIRHGEAPIEQVRVAPGLNDGYTALGSGGFHNTLRIRPQTSEEAYVNPKSSFEQRHNIGKDAVDNRTSGVNLTVYKPHTLIDNRDGKRNFVTTGEKIAPMIYSDIILKNTNRKNMKILTGFAGTSDRNDSLPCNRQQKIKKTTKKHLLNTPFRNVGTTVGNKSTNNIEIESFKTLSKETKRQDTLINYIIKGIFGEVQQVNNTANVVRNNQPAKTTRAQKLIDNRIGNVGSIVNSGHIVYDPTDTPNTTGRETIEKQKNNGYLSGQSIGQIVYDPSDAPNTTGRETIEKNTNNGYLQTSSTGHIIYDPTDAPNVTGRETIEKNTNNGYLQTSSTGHIIYDPTDAPNVTGRETYEVNKHAGIVNKTSAGHIIYDPTDAPNVTGRETYESNKHVGIVNKTSAGHIIYDPTDAPSVTGRETYESNKHVGIVDKTSAGHIIYDPYDVPLNTMRETTEVNKYIGHGDAGYLQNGKGYMTAPLDINNTQRQTYSDTMYVPPANDNQIGIRNYADTYNMRQNQQNEIVAQGRYPTLSNTSVPNGSNTINIAVKKLDNDRVNTYQCTPSLIPGGERKAISTCELTKTRNTIGARNPNFDPDILSAFNRNPLTQSLQSWA